MFNPQTLNLFLNILTVVLGGGAVGIVLRHRQVLRGLANSDIKDIRDHYASEVKRYADEVERVLSRQLECEKREEALRERIRVLEDEVTGLVRQISQYSTDRMLIMEGSVKPSEHAPGSLAAARRRGEEDPNER